MCGPASRGRPAAVSGAGMFRASRWGCSSASTCACCIARVKSPWDAKDAEERQYTRIRMNAPQLCAAVCACLQRRAGKKSTLFAERRRTGVERRTRAVASNASVQWMPVDECCSFDRPCSTMLSRCGVTPMPVVWGAVRSCGKGEHGDHWLLFRTSALHASSAVAHGRVSAPQGSRRPSVPMQRRSN
jgi:hypothetical protein